MLVVLNDGCVVDRARDGMINWVCGILDFTSVHHTQGMYPQATHTPYQMFGTVGCSLATNTAHVVTMTIAQIKWRSSGTHSLQMDITDHKMLCNHWYVPFLLDQHSGNISLRQIIALISFARDNSASIDHY